ncbi:MAG: (Fe-S)-binding protein [Hyphomicrobiaceae bacterium]|nr:MAG: (Fe-S)-binding protein [Hyphomicrobiaceae bacterium]
MTSAASAIADAPARSINVQAAVDKFNALTNAHIASYLDACVHCGQCAQACHFHEVTRDPRRVPAMKLAPITKVYRRHKAPFAGLRRTLGLAPELSRKDLEEWEELIFDSCTMCGRCTVVCPMAIDIASVVALSRQAFVAAGLGPPDLLQAADNARDRGSPLGVTREVLKDRVEWLADEHETEIRLDKPKADVLLLISSIELMKYPRSVVAMAKLLNHAGVDWTLSSRGYESTNFGFLAGKPDVARTLIARITEAAEALGARTVIVPECGHAFGVLRWSGANILGRPLPYEVRHITEFLAQHKRDGRLRFKPIDTSMTYHDPCQISRRGGATADARYLLDGVASDFREMTPTGNYNWCCGGGGGVQALGRAAEVRHEVFRIKMRQVSETGAAMMVSACSNCRLTMDESKAALGWDGELESLVELLAVHLDDTASSAPRPAR